MKIICVCGLGQGSSLILKMSVEDVLNEAGVRAEVEHSDASSVKMERCDYIVTTTGLEGALEGSIGKVIVSNSFIDKKELRKVLTEGGIITD